MTTSLKKFDTGFPADAVEFCPHPLAQDILVCGTYKLLEEQDHAGKQQRVGRCLFFAVLADGNLTLLQEFSLPAIPDIKWCHMSSAVDPVIAVADSEGGINLLHWSVSERKATLFQKVACGSADTLCLSLDWDNRRLSSRYSVNLIRDLPVVQGYSSLGSLVVSQSDGSLSLLRSRDGIMTVVENWHAHDYEPWISAWNYWDTNVIFSGGDDLRMKGWDVRQGFDSPIFENRRFESGITTIQTHPHVEHLIAVGSYDEKVRLFDTRMPLRTLQEAHVGGGVWRVKWHPSEDRREDLLVACMHDGLKVIQFDQGLPDIARGGFKLLHRGESTSLVASCSFYDQTLHLWRG